MQPIEMAYAVDSNQSERFDEKTQEAQEWWAAGAN